MKGWTANYLVDFPKCSISQFSNDFPYIFWILIKFNIMIHSSSFRFWIKTSSYTKYLFKIAEKGHFQLFFRINVNKESSFLKSSHIHGLIMYKKNMQFVNYMLFLIKSSTFITKEWINIGNVCIIKSWSLNLQHDSSASHTYGEITLK